MTLRRDMMTAAKMAAPLLGDRAELVAGFLLGQIHDDGGFKGRGPDSDLYYTVFGVEALIALKAGLPFGRIETFLHRFNPKDQDLVHLACLGRCRADLADSKGQAIDPVVRDGLLQAVKAYKEASIYECFLTLGLYQDLGWDLPDAAKVVDRIHSLQMPDGGFTNTASMQVGATPATAAAITVLHYLGQPIPKPAIGFLSSQVHPSGGFSVFPCPGSPIAPDLLSTATALYALTLAGQSLGGIRQPCLGFVESLWSPQGGFRGTATDPVVDCEYTLYGLLALGHLAP